MRERDTLLIKLISQPLRTIRVRTAFLNQSQNSMMFQVICSLFIIRISRVSKSKNAVKIHKFKNILSQTQNTS